MKIFLVVMTDGKSLGRTIPVTAPTFLIGRDADCQLRPASTLISKRHCAIEARPTGVVVRDFGSTNGTHVNETRIEVETPLRHDDVLRVGPLAFRVLLEQTSSYVEEVDPNEDVAAMYLAADDGAGQDTVETVRIARNDQEATDVEEPSQSPPTLNAQEAAQAILARFKRSRKSRTTP